MSERSDNVEKEQYNEFAERAGLLELVRDVAAAANEAKTFNEALRYILARVCKYNGWSFGHAFLVTGVADDELIPCEADYQEAPGRFEQFRAITLKTRLRRGQGLPGRVLDSGKPEWTNDLSQDLIARRADLGEALGVKMALAFPAMADDRVAAVLEVFSDEQTELSERCVETMGLVGLQLGRAAERSQAAKAAYESAERLRAILDTTADGILTIDSSGRIESFNQVAERIFGYMADEAIGKEFQVLVPASTYQGIDDWCTRCSQAGPDDTLDGRVEVMGRRKDGTTFSMDLAVNQIGYLGLYVCTMRDLTARKRAEREARKRQTELAHVARVAMMGEMAAGLAHELNQPLCALVTSAHAAQSLLKSKRLDRDKIRTAMDDIASSGKRASELIERMRKFLCKGVEAHCPVHPNDIIYAVRDISRVDAIEHEATVRFELADQLPQISGDAIQLQQALLNLVHNGLQAMMDHEPDTRELTIRTEKDKSGAAVISVRDKGIGLSKNVMHHLFKPFFTTKPAGMGMGLAIARSIVDAHGGRIWATPNSELGRSGTTFHMALPAAKDTDR